MTLVWLLVAGLILIFIHQLYSFLEIARLRRKGIYPQKGKATEADAIRLHDLGYRLLALRCYREVHPCELKQAKIGLNSLLEKRTRRMGRT